jgi:hypothetical protein
LKRGWNGPSRVWDEDALSRPAPVNCHMRSNSTSASKQAQVLDSKRALPPLCRSPLRASGTCCPACPSTALPPPIQHLKISFPFALGNIYRELPGCLFYHPHCLHSSTILESDTITEVRDESRISFLLHLLLLISSYRVQH